MVEEARLEEVGSGLAPVSPGWFVVNVGEAAWVRNDDFGRRCVFESSQRVLAERPELEPLLAMHERDRANGLMDAPWPPVYPKMPDEPPRVAPSRARKDS